MPGNPFSQTGRQSKTIAHGAAKQFYVVGTSSSVVSDYQSWFPNDEAGVPLGYSTITAALANCVASRGDVIYLSPDFTSVPTSAELLSAETKGVAIIPSGQMNNGEYFAMRATAALPATTSSAIFTVTGRVRLNLILGEVTTVIQNQANNTKLISTPTVGSPVDICAVKDIANAAVGTQLSITGTFATAMQQTASAALVYQASPVILTAGTLNLSCAATNTGSVKWLVRYVPIDPGARMIAA